MICPGLVKTPLVEKQIPEQVMNSYQPLVVLALIVPGSVSMLRSGRAARTRIWIIRLDRLKLADMPLVYA